MTLSQRRRTLKQIGVSLERAFKQIDEGIDIVDRFDQARDEKEREHYSLLVALAVHNSWQTITKIMRRIAIDVDHDMPRGSGAPTRLIMQMTERTSERPRIMNLANLEKVQEIGKFHRDFRRATLPPRPASEMINYLETINEEIAPGILENMRQFALTSPGSADLITSTRPNDTTRGQLVEIYA